MSNPMLVKNFLAGAAVSPYRIVKFGADENHVVHAAAATDAAVGVVGEIGQSTAEGRVDVVLAGVAEVTYGGTVTAGALLTAGTDGKAVAAAPASGSNARIIGVALTAGVANDVGLVLLSQCSMQG